MPISADHLLYSGLVYLQLLPNTKSSLICLTCITSPPPTSRLDKRQSSPMALPLLVSRVQTLISWAKSPLTPLMTLTALAGGAPAW